MAKKPSSTQNAWLGAFVLALFAALIRWGAMEYLSDSLLHQPKADPDAYVLIAHQLQTTGIYARDPGVPTAYRPPGYTLAIAPWCVDDFPDVRGIAILHLICAALTVGFTVLWASSMGLGRWSWLAGFIVAIDPILIRQSTLIMTETLFTMLFMAAIYFLSIGSKETGSRWWLLMSGLFWGLAILTRPTAGVVLILLGIGALRWGHKKEWLLTSLVAGLTLLPWAVRNQMVMGKPIFTTTHGGYTLWLGQNPTFFREVVQGKNEVWPEASFQEWTENNKEQTAGMNEAKQDAFYRHEALEWMWNNPDQAVKSMGHHIRSFIGFSPKVNDDKRLSVVIAFYYLAVVLTIVFIGFRWGTALVTWPGCVVPLSFLAFAMVHAIYWSDMRMRGPLAPLIATMIAGGFASLPRGTGKF